MIKHSICGLLLLLFISACEKHNGSNPDLRSTESGRNTIEQADAALWAEIDDTFSKLKQASQALAESIDAFLARPNEDTLSSAQQAWKALHAVEQKLAVIHNLVQSHSGSFDMVRATLARTSAQPIQPGYLDRVGTYAYSGLVYDIGVQLTQENLRHQHQLTDEEEVVLGIYALEFMLFGENGKRSANNYQAQTQLNSEAQGSGFKDISELPENRRRRLIQLQSNILAADTVRLLQIIRENQKGSAKKKWFALSDQEKVSAVRNALRHTLTQTLLELSHLETKLHQNTNEELPSAPSDTEHAAQANALKSRLLAASPIAGYLSQTEEETLRKAIRDAQTLLNVEALLSRPQDERKEAMKALYQALQSLM